MVKASAGLQAPFLFFLIVSVGWSQPALIHYQGRLVSGTNLVSGPVGLSLRLYNAITGGTLLYEDSNTVTVIDGLYSTSLGDNTTFGSLSAALTNAFVFLEVAVNGTPLTPRERVASVAYSLQTAGLLLTPNNSVILNPSQQIGADSGVFYGVIGGGGLNRAGGFYTVVAGGYSNYAMTMHSTIGGGAYNLVFGQAGTIAGGEYNAANIWSSVGGGVSNAASGGWGTIAGGRMNQAQGAGSAIAGGTYNIVAALASNAAIGGGSFNYVLGEHGTVPGGYFNVAGRRAFAAGTYASATNEGAFVWSDSRLSAFGSTASNQFLVRAGGGVGINTNNPQATLHVAGEAMVSQLPNAAKFGVVTVSATGGAVLFEHPAFPLLKLIWNSSTRVLTVTNESATWFDASAQFIGTSPDSRALDIRTAERPALSVTNPLASAAAGWHVICVREGHPGPGFIFQGSGYQNYIQGLITYWY